MFSMLVFLGVYNMPSILKFGTSFLIHKEFEILISEIDLTGSVDTLRIIFLYFRVLGVTFLIEKESKFIGFFPSGTSTTLFFYWIIKPPIICFFKTLLVDFDRLFCCKCLQLCSNCNNFNRRKWRQTVVVSFVF